jgi:hypothetical protein
MTTWLQRQPQWFLAVYAGFAAFATYSCMYAFRKPFTAADFATVGSIKVSYKVWLVAAQVLGYMFSKFYGIRFIAEMKSLSRMRSIILLIIIAWLALLLFAVVPVSLKPLCMFANGFPLGMIWGLVFGYLEGRRTTEMMGAVLASSFLFASGFAKTTGKWLINDLHVSQFWMPFFAGSIFILPMLLFVRMLNAIPPPTAEDIASRTLRQPMNKSERKSFVQQFLPGLFFLILAYILITALRDLRDNFMNEIWTGLGQPASAATFTQTELPATFIVLAATASLIVVKRNRLAFILTHGMILAGLLIALISTWAFTTQYISPYWWMLLTGVGLYISYIPINCIFFERMLATYRIAANVGFVMYIADAFGYFGSLSALFLKEFSGLQLPWVSFYTQILFTGGIISLLSIGLSALYFNQKRSNSTVTVPNVVAAV